MRCAAVDPYRYMQAWSLSLIPTIQRCRYTGYVQGLHETYKKTPVMAQLETKAPEPSSFLHTRTARPAVATPHRVRGRIMERREREEGERNRQRETERDTEGEIGRGE